MLDIRYLIILVGKNRKKISFGNFYFWVAEAGKLQKHVVPRPPWDPPQDPNMVKHT